MDVALYTSGRGTMLLVPACMHPPKVAEHLYGPLVLCAHSELARFDDTALRTRIEDEIDLHAYAVVEPSDAKRVLGGRHACFRKRPHGVLHRIRRRRRNRATTPQS